MKGETADRILSTARELMTERGYSAFSYADIADAIGITKASIHFHYPTKAVLAIAVLRAHRQGLAKAMEMLDTKFSDPALRLQSYVKYWEGCIRDGSIPFCVAALLAAELPSLPDEVQAEVRLHFQDLSAWIQRTMAAGAQQGTIRLESSAESEAQLFMAAVHGAMLSARVSGNCEVFQLATDAALKRITP
ncbi:TetR/AcrR family transcriptional regulator [Terriglobus roseus]|uniref:Transcriptional regulator, TetR family n=1 Tax=Terriglobus roseus TaxID=392734 RepID=A0A1G7QMX3_9BACT|nr:TetR/AcrR family transcriptional regulator [Terriglobus roseus]SDF99838.1 transcriptional regulator, TetR family [Terriglobus roseus]